MAGGRGCLGTAVEGLMSRGAQSFRQGDVIKAVKAVEKAGLKVSRVEIRIILFTGRPQGDEAALENSDDLRKLL
jgi:hypothetical protein